jgi:hypothetical protein
VSTSSPSKLEEVIRQSGEGWLIDSFDPPENAVRQILQTLDAVQREARKRLGAAAPQISEAALLEEFGRNPRRVRGFLQALAGTRTPSMLLMAWRILQGMELKQVQLQYQRQESFQLRVVLESPYGELDPPYESTNIHDFALLRHIGILEIGGAPVFDGFYALRIRES